MALIMPDANVAGSVSFGGENCCVQSQCSIVALVGEVSFGGGNVVDSCATIMCTIERPFIIGDGNRFEAKSVVTDCQIANFCVIGAGAKLTGVSMLGGNVIAPKVELENRLLDINECVFFKNGVIVSEIRPGQLEKQQAFHSQYVSMLGTILKAGKLKKL